MVIDMGILDEIDEFKEIAENLTNEIRKLREYIPKLIEAINRLIGALNK